MADFRTALDFRDDDAGALDAVVNETAGGGEVVDILEPLRDVGGDLDSIDPGRNRRIHRIFRVSEALAETGSVNKLVNEQEILVSERGA